MKNALKIGFLALALGVFAASCGGGNQTPAEDSTATSAIDSSAAATVDTAAASVDSAAATVDSAKTAVDSTKH